MKTDEELLDDYISEHFECISDANEAFRNRVKRSLGFAGYALDYRTNVLFKDIAKALYLDKLAERLNRFLS